MKFLFFVEGYTEKKSIAGFLKRWLDARLRQPVGIQTIRFDGWGEMLKDMANKTQRHLQGPRQADVIAVVALLDLYGPTIYPAHVKTVGERYAWAVKDVTARVNQERFRMYFAVHEVEAWLLSQPDIFPSPVAGKFPGRVQQPETVDFDTPPAKLLDHLYNQHLRKDYNKIVYGYELFQKLDPNVVYQKCPYFARMMDDLLELARKAGC